MKRIIALLALILAPALSFAQTNVIQNEAGTSYAPNAGNINSNVAVDRALRLIVSLSAGVASSANNPIAKVGQASTVAGDAVMTSGGFRNETGASQGSDFQRTILSTNRAGAAHVEVATTHQFAGNATGLLKLESSTVGASDALVAVGGKTQAALSVDAADGQYGLYKLGLDGRLITAYAPAGETFAQCSSVETGTAARAIKNGVASNRHYVSSLSCYNTSAVASTIIFQDGSTTFYGGGLPSNVATGIGTLILQFPVPLRFGSGNPINFQLGTTATNTICCVAGYISVS